MPVDDGALLEALEAAALRSGAFASVTAIEAPPASSRERAAARTGTPPGAVTATARASGGAPLDAGLLDRAFRADIDVVLRFRVDRSVATWVDHDWVCYPLNIGLGLLGLGIPGDLLFPGEVYRGELSVTAEAWAVGSRTMVWSERRRRSETRSVYHLDRGFIPDPWLGSFSVPDGISWLAHVGALGRENFRDVGSLLLPYARNALAACLCADLASLRDAEKEVFAPGRLSKTVAVCVGAGHYRNSEVPDVLYASDDAREWRTMLEAGGVPPCNIACLTSVDARAPDAASRERVLSALREAAGRTREGDLLEVYFSGHGFASPGELYLVPDDLDPSRDPTTTSLSLREIGRAISGAKGSQVLILDTSFSEEAPDTGPPRRTLPARFVPAPRAETTRAEESALEAFAREVKGRVVITACPAGQTARNSDLEKGGSLTTKVEKAWGVKSGRRGWLHADELLDLARRLAAQNVREKPPEVYPSGVDEQGVRVLPVPRD